MTVNDPVNHPEHYTSHPSGIECIEIVRHFGYNLGNAIKYIWRVGLKKDEALSDIEKEIEDINKAIFYLQDHLNTLEEKL